MLDHERFAKLPEQMQWIVCFGTPKMHMHAVDAYATISIDSLPPFQTTADVIASSNEGWLASRSLSSQAVVVRLRVAPRRLRRTAFACSRERRLVSLNFASWNRREGWLRGIDGLRAIA